VPDPDGISNPWPSLAARVVVIGGLPVTYGEALRAAGILAASRTSAIGPVLRSAGSPLADCDYRAAARPYLERELAAPKTGRRGAAGRHVVKNAFIETVTAGLAAARECELSAALAAFAEDERYAAAVATEAVSLRERSYAAGVRSAVRAAAGRAVAACGALAGQFECDAETACGTGACRFAAGPCRAVTAPAAPGKFTRPANHVRAGAGFTDAGAAAQVAAAGSYRAGITVWDGDGLVA
jgi:hypothetical protein